MVPLATKRGEKDTVMGIGDDDIGKRMRRTRSTFDSSVAQSRLRGLLELGELMRRTISSPPYPSGLKELLLRETETGKTNEPSLTYIPTCVWASRDAHFSPAAYFLQRASRFLTSGFLFSSMGVSLPRYSTGTTPHQTIFPIIHYQQSFRLGTPSTEWLI